eukprot:gene4100-7388_t
MGQGLIPISESASSEEVDLIVMFPIMTMDGPKNVASCTSTNNKKEFLVATSSGDIILYCLEEKKETKRWKQNERLTNITFCPEENEFFTSYFKIEEEEDKYKGALRAELSIFLEIASIKKLKGKQPGEGVLRWNFESTKPELEIPGRFPFIIFHSGKLLVQTKPGVIGEYTTGKFKKYLDGKISKYLILDSLGSSLIGVVAGTSDLYLWDEKKKVKQLFDSSGSDEIIKCVCGISDKLIAFSIENNLYFCQVSSLKLRSFAAHAKDIVSITCLGELFLATIGSDGLMKFWEIDAIYKIFEPKKEETSFQSLKQKKMNEKKEDTGLLESIDIPD